eukprot:6756314-Lingulodinium_polyedra.AAC.1
MAGNPDNAPTHHAAHKIALHTEKTWRQIAGCNVTDAHNACLQHSCRRQQCTAAPRGGLPFAWMLL